MTASLSFISCGGGGAALDTYRPISVSRVWRHSAELSRGRSSSAVRGEVASVAGSYSGRYSFFGGVSRWNSAVREQSKSRRPVCPLGVVFWQRADVLMANSRSKRIPRGPPRRTRLRMSFYITFRVGMDTQLRMHTYSHTKRAPAGICNRGVFTSRYARPTGQGHRDDARVWPFLFLLAGGSHEWLI